MTGVVEVGSWKLEVGRNKVSLRDGSFKWIPASAGMTSGAGLVGSWVKAFTYGQAKQHAHASVGMAPIQILLSGHRGSRPTRAGAGSHGCGWHSWS